jgi:hypothetical protein
MAKSILQQSTAALVVVVVVLGMLVAVQAVTLQNCKGHTNELPITTTSPTPWREVENGSAFLAGNVEPQIKVIHMWGTAYQQGRAQGELLKDVLPGYMGEVLDYIHEQIDEVGSLTKSLKWSTPCCGCVQARQAGSRVSLKFWNYIELSSFSSSRRAVFTFSSRSFSFLFC